MTHDARSWSSSTAAASSRASGPPHCSTAAGWRGVATSSSSPSTSGSAHSDRSTPRSVSASMATPGPTSLSATSSWRSAGCAARSARSAVTRATSPSSDSRPVRSRSRACSPVAPGVACSTGPSCRAVASNAFGRPSQRLTWRGSSSSRSAMSSRPTRTSRRSSSRRRPSRPASYRRWARSTTLSTVT